MNPPEFRISAMMRIKDEEDFLRPSVLSILDLVDEIILVDNLSTDKTPHIIDELKAAHPHKIRSYQYRHHVARVGEENRQLSESWIGRYSPRLLANFYNWCLKRCTMPFVLKWDGDMLATPSFARELAAFQQTDKRVLRFRGANVHPDLIHLVGDSRLTDADTASIGKENAQGWVAPYTSYHPHLFRRKGAYHSRAFWYCERLETGASWNRIQQSEEICFAHLKWLKPEPLANMANDFKQVLNKYSAGHELVTDEVRATITRWCPDLRPRA